MTYSNYFLSKIFVYIYTCLSSPPCQSEDEAVEKRRCKKSVVELSRFDWSKVPRYAQRRQAEEPIDYQPELITIRLKL